MKQVKIFELTNGKTYVGIEDQESFTDTYEVKMLMHPDGNFQVGILPVGTPLSKQQGIKIPKELAMLIYEPNDEFLSEYYKVTSNLIIANKMPNNLAS
jgi:hypothetical protein